MSTRRIGIAIAALPGVLMLALFYSLAVHMHHPLGGWPTSIGERGFPPILVTHATVTMNFFVGLIASLIVSPIPFLACVLVKRWQRLATYFAVFAAVALSSIVLTQLAPEPFLYWWRD